MGPPRAAPIQRLMASLQEIGLTACAMQFQQAGGFLFGDDPGEFVVQPLGPDANRWPTVVTMQTTRPGAGGSRLTTLVVSPGATCSGFYEQKVAWEEPCAAVAKLYFPTLPRPRPFAGVGAAAVLVSDASPSLQLYLMPAGKGCVSLKKELFH